MPMSSSARGTYSVKFPCARIARIRGSLPPSPNMTLNFARSTVTRALITTRRMPNTPAYRAVIGIGKPCMIDLRMNGCRREIPAAVRNLAPAPTNSKKQGKYANPRSVELVDRARPARLEQAREGAVGEDLAAGLTARAVVRLVLRVHDALHGRAAHRAGPAKPPVHRHALAKGGDLLRKSRACLLAQPLGPFGERHPRCIAEPPHVFLR